jgi:DNA-binding MarR family transcriptional regulator
MGHKKRDGGDQDKDPRFQAWYGNMQATMRSLQRIDRDVEAATGLPIASIELLVNVAMMEGERIRMGELADTLLLSRGGATRLVARLEDAGFVRREIPPDDRRATYAVLTDEGRELLEIGTPAMKKAVEEHYLGYLDEDELAVLRKASLKILDVTGSNCDWLMEDLREAEESAGA